MNYRLPESLEVCGVEYEIRTDYRAALDVFAALDDPELDSQDRALALLVIMYPGFEDMPPEHWQAATDAALVFLNGGSKDAPQRKRPRLVSWQQDFQYIVAPINKIVGADVRGMEHMHWWTFLSAYYEIGECTFSQIVRIRELRSRGKPLDKTDREWYLRNRHMVDFETKYTETENELLKKWGG